MELKHVKIFVLAAELLNFSKVADTAFISQSSVSKYIQSLEDELGGPLFIRDGRQMQLSDVGRLFLPYAQSLLEKEQESLDVLRSYQRGSGYDILRIGVDDSLCVAPPETFFVQYAQALKEIHLRNPGLSLELGFYPSEDITAMLENRRFDMAIMIYSSSQIKNMSESIFENRCLALSRNYLAVSPETDVSGGYEEVIANINTYMLDGNPMPTNMTYSVVNRFGGAMGLKIYRHWMDLYLGILLENEGKMAAILPENMMHIAEACGIKMLPMGDFDIQSGLYCFWRRDNDNPNIRPMLDLLTEAFTQGSGEAE